MRLRGLLDVAALPRAYIAKVAEQKGGKFSVSKLTNLEEGPSLRGVTDVQN